MQLTVTPTALPEVLILEPRVFADERGVFFESFNARDFATATGLQWTFVQDNQSYSKKGVLRGLHYQIAKPQCKLVRAVYGEVFDVAVDVRRDSATFGRWVGVCLSAENRKQLWIPSGFAHGLVVTSDSATVQYKTTEYWYPDHERTIVWNDPDLAIAWPVSKDALNLSARDRAAPRLKCAEVFTNSGGSIGAS